MNRSYMPFEDQTDLYDMHFLDGEADPQILGLEGDCYTYKSEVPDATVSRQEEPNLSSSRKFVQLEFRMEDDLTPTCGLKNMYRDFCGISEQETVDTVTRSQVISNLGKRSPEMDDSEVIQIFVDSLCPRKKATDGSDDDYSILIRLMLNLLDRVVPCQSDINTLKQGQFEILKRYAGNLFKTEIGQSADRKTFVDHINTLYSRTEIKKKTIEQYVRKVFRGTIKLMISSFRNINKLSRLSDSQVAKNFVHAYFGQADGFDVSSNIPIRLEISKNCYLDEEQLITMLLTFKDFHKKHGLAFIKHDRFREDFEAILSTSYVDDLYSKRQQKMKAIIQTISKFEEVKRSDDVFKNPPWSIQEIATSVEYCQLLCNKSAQAT